MENYKVLIVDDGYENQKSVIAALNEIGSISYDTVISARDALRRLSVESYDLMIVDIQIPDFASGDICIDGGVRLLEHISVSDNINKPYHIVGITSHEQSFKDHSSFFSKSGWPLILDWGIDEIKALLMNKLSHTPARKINVNTAIITALRKVELDEVLKLPCNWKPHNIEDDNNIYHLGEYLNSRGESKTILATSCSRMGVAASTATAMKVCEKFSPKTLIMTGIAAGIPGKVNLGDILVADPCWDWGSGKVTYREGKTIFLSSPHQLHISTKHRAFFQNISASRDYLDEIYASWSSPGRPNHSLNLHVGPVATGSVVLEDPATVEDIKSQHRELIGIEMEGYGLFSAVNYSSAQVEPLVIKSVCDFADPDKNDDWQMYAAFTSAQIAYKFLTNY